MASLTELADKYGTDKGNNDHLYTIMYERLLSTINVDSLLEIGLGAGASIRMWMEYYPKAKIYCIEDFGDENTDKWGGAKGDIEGLNLINGDSTKKETWDNVPYDLDVIIDDGDHHPDSQLASLAYGFMHLRTAGLYFIEDTHCNFTQLYTGGHDILYGKIFDLIIKQQIPQYSTNGNFYYNQKYMAPEAQPIYSYHFYKSVIVLEKA